MIKLCTNMEFETALTMKGENEIHTAYIQKIRRK